ncbi:hypothetical protein [Nonomuraea sp. B1E8]
MTRSADLLAERLRRSRILGSDTGTGHSATAPGTAVGDAVA